jgi:hypothetical protein
LNFTVHNGIMSPKRKEDARRRIFPPGVTLLLGGGQQKRDAGEAYPYIW